MRLSLLDVKLCVRSESVVNSVLVSPREDCLFDGCCVWLVGKYSDVVKVFVDVDKNPGLPAKYKSNQDTQGTLESKGALFYLFMIELISLS